MGVVGGDWKAHQRARCMVTGYLTRLLYRHAEVQAGGGLIVCLPSLNLPSFHVLLTLPDALIFRSASALPDTYSIFSR